MSLSAALNNAAAGLRSNAAGMETISRNLAGAGTARYARRDSSALETLSGGVRESEVQRQLSASLQARMWSEAGATGHANALADALSQLDETFGAAGRANGLDTVFNGFSSSLTNLRANPDNGAAQLELAQAAEQLAESLRGLSADAQDLRASADVQIGAAVLEANDSLAEIERIERQIVSTPAGNARLDLMDERDGQIARLAGLMDIRVSPAASDRVIIATTGGQTLFQGAAARLSFTSSDSAPSVTGTNGVSIVGPAGTAGVETPLPIRSGAIAGLLEVRDRALPAAQQALDEIAAALAEAGAGPPDLFMDRGAGVAIQPFAGGAQKTGLASRLAVNPQILAQPTDFGGAAPGARADAVLAAIKGDALSVAPTQAAGVSGYDGTLEGYVVHVQIAHTGAVRGAKAQQESQQIVSNSLADRFQTESGVSAAEELSRLLALQNAYSANARVISVVNQMFDALMQT